MSTLNNVSGRDAGYVLPTTALLLVPLFIFAAFAVDIGAWTAQAARSQSAADAAALAAAPYMPDADRAVQAALEVAELNGYVDGVDGVEVEVGFDNDGGVLVSVSEPGETFFGGMVLDDEVKIERQAGAAALAPVGFGSPENVLGFGKYSLDGARPSNYWINEGGRCRGGRTGDIKATDYPRRVAGCHAKGTVNPYWHGLREGRQTGTFFRITVPPGLDTSSTLYVADPGECPAYGSKPPDSTFMWYRQWSTGEVAGLAADDSAISDWWKSDDCLADLPHPHYKWTDFTQGWTKTPFTFPPNTSGQPETHLIQTRIDPRNRNSRTAYALWVKPDNETTSCISIASDQCPGITAEDWLPVKVDPTVKSQPLDVYLAEIGPERLGQTLNVGLWDPGEGMEQVQILDPNGNPLDFTWTSDHPSYRGPLPADQCAEGPCLKLYPGFTGFPGKHRWWPSSFRFDGVEVHFRVRLDDQVDYASYTDHWYELRYEPPGGKAVEDSVSISVTMEGVPTRLTD